MSLQRYLWQYPNPVPEIIQEELDTFSPAIQSVLSNRGITTLEDALNFLLPKAPEWSSKINLLHSDKASQLIIDAIQNKEVIGVYGDYDADGITSTALITLALRELGASVITYIPDRQNEGYGLNKLAIKSLRDQGVSLLITVDNGIRSHDEIIYANSLKIIVIVTDHHTPGETIPPAAALLNPKLPDDPYPNKNLAGVGVAYKLVCALSKYMPQLNPEDYLDLVAIGTVADIVPLTGENRYLTRKGLTRLNFNQRQSILSLLGASGNVNKVINSSDISYQIAPRINSSGRLDSETAQTPLNLLLSSDVKNCSEYAQKLENHNFKRKALSKDLEIMVEKIISDQTPLPPLLMVFAPDISIGLAGIAAGYLSRKYNLPAIVGQTGDKNTTASCRSVLEFNIINALDSCQDLFVHYGGHSLAAGFTIKNTNITKLRAHLTDLALFQLSETSRLPALKIDAELTLEDLNISLYKEIQKLEPVGAGNPVPVFVTKNLRAVKPKRVGKNSDHLKMVVTDGTRSFDAICFGLGDLFFNLPPTFDLAYNLTSNDYLGPGMLQLQVLDLVPS
jgi:single-stranded-DNA-specific exonuclease